MANTNFVYKHYVSPYNDIHAGDLDSRRLSVDIPLDVRQRIHNLAPFRGLWKYALGSFINALDAEIQKQKIRADFSYPATQDAVFEIIDRLTLNHKRLELKDFLEDLKTLNKPQVREAHTPAIED